MMVPAVLLVGTLGAVVAAWGGARGGRAARAGALGGTLALLVVLVAVLAMDVPAATASPAGSLFGGQVVPSGYLRLVVALWALDAILVIAIAWLLGGITALRGLLPATLAAVVGTTIALGAASLVLGSLAASATGLAALVVVLASDRAPAVPAAARELRVSLGGAALLLAAVAVLPVGAALAFGDGGLGAEAGVDPSSAATAGTAGAVVGLALLAVALVVGIRAGAVPFHVRVPRLGDAIPPIAVPLLLAWLPLPVGVVGLTAVDRLVVPLALPLEGERAIIVGFALLTLAAAAVAAFIADDVRHAVGYLIVTDAGFVLLGLAALDPEAWGATRTWIVVLAVSKTALAAWAAVAEARFETRGLPDLRGWIRRAPILAAGLAVATLATFGLPGWVAFEARGDLARLVAGSPWDALIVIAGLLALPAYLRILAIGLGPVSTPVRRAAPERIVRTRRPAETLAVEIEGAAAPEGGSRTGEAPVGQPAPGSATGEAPVPQPASERTPASPMSRLAAASALGSRVILALRRDRTELTSAAVLALAILAALTSWGALDVAGTASEPAPIVVAE
jgi:NADH:ubiquinone oxidoreductase subunit 2 (subunit N)